MNPPPASRSQPPTSSSRREVLAGIGLLAAGGLLGLGLEARYGLSEEWPSFLRRWRSAHRRWPEDPVPTIPQAEQGRLDLFVLAGQSNMSGRGRIAAGEQPGPGSIYVFGNDYRWHRAREPVDNGFNQVDSVSFDVVVGAGPGLAFGERWSELRPATPVGLIPCALGGSSISDWTQSRDDSTLYGSMLKRCRAASTMGRVRGILFFQGESDASKERAPQWPERFETWVRAVRQDLGDPELPIVFAQIGSARDWRDPPAWTQLQELQASIDLPGVAMLKTSDLPLADGLHFTTESYQVIGQRFAEALSRLIPASPAEEHGVSRP